VWPPLLIQTAVALLFHRPCGKSGSQLSANALKSGSSVLACESFQQKLISFFHNIDKLSVGQKN
jgi:hypothetical protein